MKKGFTLIELLAVIVILAIIVLITVPLISKVVDKAKRNTAIDSSYGYIDAVEKYLLLNNINKIGDELIDGEYELPLDDKYKVKVKGTLPKNGNLIVENNKIKSAIMCINNYEINYENGKSTIDGNCIAKPTIVENSLKITLADGSEFTDLQEKGTPLKIAFKATIEGGNITQVTSPEGAQLNSETGEITYITDGNQINLNFEIIGKIANDESRIKKMISLKKYYETVIESESLLKAIGDNKIENDAITKIIVNDTIYTAHTYNYDHDLTLNASEENDEKVETIISYGSQSDVATSSANAKNMIILKVNGDLTIDDKVILTTVKSDDGYGGPKGFLIYATGNIINNGTISMTARGAKAEGQNVYLFKNTNGEYEVVPSSGANGGGGFYSQDGRKHGGNIGTDGKDRKTGGGGSGYSTTESGEGRQCTSGAGAIGTSYSGGSGGGGCADYRYSYHGAAGSASGNGGIGGYARGDRASAGGGAGNPGGNSADSGSNNNSSTRGEDGTGGLLIMYANNITNNKIISSEGSSGANYGKAGGGSSGGGSINIFYVNNYTLGENGKLSAIGGQKISNGGSGGTGSIAVGKIENGSYVDTYHNWTN